MPAHGLDQLVDLLVVFQGVSQGILRAEQPLTEAVHLRVQGRGVQHGIPPVVGRRPFPTLKHKRQEGESMQLLPHEDRKRDQTD